MAEVVLKSVVRGAQDVVNVANLLRNVHHNADGVGSNKNPWIAVAEVVFSRDINVLSESAHACQECGITTFKSMAKDGCPVCAKLTEAPKKEEGKDA